MKNYALKKNFLVIFFLKILIFLQASFYKFCWLFLLFVLFCRSSLCTIFMRKIDQSSVLMSHYQSLDPLQFVTWIIRCIILSSRSAYTLSWCWSICNKARAATQLVHSGRTWWTIAHRLLWRRQLIGRLGLGADSVVTSGDQKGCYCCCNLGALFLKTLNLWRYCNAEPNL